MTEALSLSAGAAFSPLELLTLSCLCNTSHDVGLQSVQGPTTHSNIVVCSLERRSSMPSLTSLLQSSMCRLSWSWSSAGAGPIQVSVFIVFFPLMFSSRVYVSIHGYALVFRVPITIPLMMIFSTARAGISKGLCLVSPTAHIVCKHCDRVYMIRQSHCVTVVVLYANSKVHSTLSFLPP